MTVSPPPPSPPSSDENRGSPDSLSEEVIQKSSTQSSPDEKSEKRQSSSSSSSSDGSKATSRRRRKVHRLSRLAESSSPCTPLEVQREMPSSSSGPPSPYRCFRDKELPKIQLRVPGLSMKTYKWVVWKLWNKLLEDEVDGSLIEESIAHINVLYMLDYSMRSIETPLDITFGELKQLIQASFDIPTEGRCLIYNGAYMMDHLTLESRGMMSGDCVQVTRPR